MSSELCGSLGCYFNLPAEEEGNPEQLCESCRTALDKSLEKPELFHRHYLHHVFELKKRDMAILLEQGLVHATDADELADNIFETLAALSTLHDAVSCQLFSWAQMKMSDPMEQLAALMANWHETAHEQFALRENFMTIALPPSPSTTKH